MVWQSNIKIWIDKFVLHVNEPDFSVKKSQETSTAL